jgi:repressor LexA
MHIPERTEAILAYIVRFRADHGAPPTIREIGNHFRIRSTNGVCYHLDLLEREGLILRRKGHARGIQLRSDVLGAEPETALWPGLPIVGRVAAGGPVTAEENIEGFLDAQRLTSGTASFALRVVGDSMRDAGILDGDLVLVAPVAEPGNGEIVVAMIGDETTVKRFLKRAGRIVLQPENPAYQPIVVTRHSPELRILGKVVGVYRALG